MKPSDQMWKLYNSDPRKGCEEAQWDIEMHMAYGYLISTPKFIAMARPVRKDWPHERIADIRQTEPRETADCWFIWLLCGNMKEAVKHLPYSLPWIGFARRGKPARFVEASRMLNKVLAI